MTRPHMPTLVQVSSGMPVSCCSTVLSSALGRSVSTTDSTVRPWRTAVERACMVAETHSYSLAGLYSSARYAAVCSARYAQWPRQQAIACHFSEPSHVPLHDTYRALVGRQLGPRVVVHHVCGRYAGTWHRERLLAEQQQQAGGQGVLALNVGARVTGGVLHHKHHFGLGSCVG